VIVCHCRVINDKKIDAAIDSGALHVDEVTATCGAGADCSGCHDKIREMIDARDPRLVLRSA
jgi:bacterioferritin-associated ferredoxin